MDDYRTVFGVHDADLVKVAGMVGSDDHGQAVIEVFSRDRVVEGVKNGPVVNIVPVGAGSDEWLLHPRQVTVEATTTAS